MVKCKKKHGYIIYNLTEEKCGKSWGKYKRDIQVLANVINYHMRDQGREYMNIICITGNVKKGNVRFM